jgi:hypothetical protein
MGPAGQVSCTAGCGWGFEAAADLIPLHSPMMKGRMWTDLGFDLVGRTGFEPVTSSVSECRFSGSGRGFAAVTWAYASCARVGLPCMSRITPVALGVLGLLYGHP